MFEICLKRGWAVPAKACLDLCKMVEKRMWGSMTPLRQFPDVHPQVIRKAEGKQFVRLSTSNYRFRTDPALALVPLLRLGENPALVSTGLRLTSLDRVRLRLAS